MQKVKSWKLLPSEILDTIFLHLSEEKTCIGELLQCALVCEHWRKAAQHVIFEHVTLNKENQALTIMKTLVKSTGSPGESTRILDYNVLVPNRNNKHHDELILLFTLFNRSTGIILIVRIILVWYKQK